MSCRLSKAPINIPNKSDSRCVEKCNLVFNYGDSSINLSNKGDYISLDYDSSSTNVTYNTIKMEVNEIRIYTPSLHTYDGLRADAEMIIVHSGFGENLLLCIPMKASEYLDSNSNTLNIIFENAVKKIINKGDSTSLSSLTWNLNDFVPNKKPLFSYTSTLPYTPCSGSYNYLVWNMNDYTIPIPKKVITLLQGTPKTKGLIDKHQYDIKNGIDIFYNEYGAVNSNFVGDDDDIYIECNPTGDDGEILYSKKTSQDESTYETLSFETIIKNPITIMLIAIIICTILFQLWVLIKGRFNSGNMYRQDPVSDLLRNDV